MKKFSSWLILIQFIECVQTFKKLNGLIKIYDNI